MSGESKPRYDDEHPFYEPRSLVTGPHMKVKPVFISPVTRMTEHWYA